MKNKIISTILTLLLLITLVGCKKENVISRKRVSDTDVGKKIQEDIADFLPYDMSKQQYSRTVGAMKRLLEQAIKRHYSKQKS